MITKIRRENEIKNKKKDEEAEERKNNKMRWRKRENNVVEVKERKIYEKVEY